MNATTPKDADVAFLSTPSIVLSNIPAPNTQGWYAQQSTGGFGAKPETMRFIKERSFPQRQLHFVIFEDEQGNQLHFTCEVVEASDGTWSLQGGAGGSTGRGPQHPSPRVNLGGSGGSTDQFYAGGYVEHNGYTVARVHLLSANNVLLVDTVDDNIVLFLDDRFIEFPMQALLYDAQGTLLNTHPVLPG